MIILYYRERAKSWIPDDWFFHPAPEYSLRPEFRKMFGKRYFTSDIAKRNPDIRANLENIPILSNSITASHCSHVLEHIRDDRKAIAELFRILKPQGTITILVPIGGKETIDDPKVTTDEERLEHYGQKDHLRLYGMDIVDKLTEAGFGVQIIKPTSLVTFDQQILFGITQSAGIIFECTKPECANESYLL